MMMIRAAIWGGGDIIGVFTPTEENMIFFCPIRLNFAIEIFKIPNFSRLRCGAYRHRKQMFLFKFYKYK